MVGYLALTECASFFFVVGAAFSLQMCVLPQPAKVCLAFLRPAVCAAFSAVHSALGRLFFLGFRVWSARGSLFSSFLLLCLLGYVFVLVGLGAASFFYCPIRFCVDERGSRELLAPPSYIVSADRGSGFRLAWLAPGCRTQCLQQLGKWGLRVGFRSGFCLVFSSARHVDLQVPSVELEKRKRKITRKWKIRRKMMMMMMMMKKKEIREKIKTYRKWEEVKGKNQMKTKKKNNMKENMKEKWWWWWWWWWWKKQKKKNNKKTKVK